jgi:2-(1,2-epoxy-1,2-dihydrophenyl)acetyl-CoA isomerase
MYETIVLEKENGTAILTLNRPEKLNAVNMTMRSEILAALSDIESDEGVKVLIVTGSGREFCAGADVNEFAVGVEDVQIQQTINKKPLVMPRAFYDFEKPVLGAINGVAAGEGAQWALAFDLNIASEKAKFAWPATYLGIL